MGFSGGGGSQTRPHTHDGLQINDGGSLNFDNVTQAGPLTAGDITYSDGVHLQRLPIGNAGDLLATNGAGTAPEWAAGVFHDAGMVAMWAGTNAAIPTGWLLCDGSSVATATYADLFGALGYTYGGGGANFNLPDLVTRFPRGVATQTAATGGADNVTLTIAEMPSHDHTVTDPGHAHTNIRRVGGGGSYFMETSAANQGGNTSNPVGGSSTTGITLANTGGGGSFDNRPAYLEIQFIIKT